MNTNMTGVRFFYINRCVLVFLTKVASALGGLNEIVIQFKHRHREGGRNSMGKGARYLAIFLVLSFGFLAPITPISRGPLGLPKTDVFAVRRQFESR